jgi:site-specific recombinase XerC
MLVAACRPPAWERKRQSRAGPCSGSAISTILNLPSSTALVLPASRRAYQFGIDEFIAWYCSEPRLAFSRVVVTRYRLSLEARGLAASSINQRLAAVRRLAYEAADCGLLSPELAAGIRRVNRTCAKLCHTAGGELEQIQFLLGHSSVQTTERYLGCKQNLGSPVNDRFAPGTA